jgi:short-subunit dehydrogenase
VHAVVTGASAGIGEAVVRELARRGMDVTLVARRKDVLDRVAGQLPTRSHVIVRDLSDPSCAEGILAEAEAALGPIDVLVSNAGFMTLGAVATFDHDEADRLIAINFLTPMRLLRAALPRMIARGTGTVVNVTSIAAFVTMPDWAYQSASKTASAVFSEALKTELRGTGVHSLTVYPGLNDTEMKRSGLESYGDPSLMTKLMPVGRPSAFATIICDAIETKKRRVIYPRVYGLVRWFPRISQWLSERVGPRVRDRRSPR